MKYVLFIILLCLSKTVFGQSKPFGDVINYFNSTKEFNGAVVIATNGNIDYLSGVGISNRQSQTKINSKSRFKIASVTKTFTAVLIMQLYEQGQLSLKESIGKYLPEYKGEGKNKVSIEQLLTYSSGIPDCEKYGGFEIYQKPIAIDSFIAKYCSGKLEFEPGSKFSYNNSDYVILGRIVEKILGKTFTHALNERILRPLGMTNTNMLASREIVTGLVQTYSFNDSTKLFYADDPYYIENFFAAGAMYSTVEDLLKFDSGVFKYQLLTKKTVDYMLTPNPKLDNVGVGFWISEKYGALNSKFSYRPGGIYGATANWIHVLDSHRTFILLSNTNATNLFELTQQLNAVANGEAPAIPMVAKAKTAKDDLRHLAGTWSIDLRPTPDAEAYLKDFIVQIGEGKFFGGEFYGSAFSNGQFNTDWDHVYFAFTTTDKENTYFHSGYFDGNQVYGNSYSAERKFISHWSGKRK